MSNLRREFLKSAVAAFSRFLVPRPQFKYPKPPFYIGDKVADHWIDEFDRESVEYGEVYGICWHPREKTWAYLIDWTSGGMAEAYYPCFDERFVIGGDLRLVSHA